MSDGESLFAVLVLLYLSECFLWMNTQTVAFISLWGKSWQPKFTSSTIQIRNGGILFLNPLIPFARPFVCQISPVSISPVGICAYNLQSLGNAGRASQSGKYFLFANSLVAKRDGNVLQVNCDAFVKCGTVQEADVLVRLINSLACVTERERQALIESSMRKEFDIEKAASLLNQSKELAKPIEVVSSILFVMLFLMIPVWVTIFGLGKVLVPAAVMMVGFAALIGFMFYRAHKQLFPELGEERTTHVIKMLLCPPAALRASDSLTSNVVSGFSPVVVAQSLGVDDCEHFLSSFLRDLKYPLAHDLSGPIAIDIVRSCADDRLTACIEYLKKTRGIDLPTAFTPKTQEKDCYSYCPRCESQFVSPSGSCPECPGIDLIAFPGAICNRENVTL